MIRLKLDSLLHLSNCVRYESLRGVRRGVTIPLKIVKPLFPTKKVSQHREKELRKITRDNRGVGHSLRGYMENHSISLPNDVEIDDLDDLDMSMEDSKSIFRETKKYISLIVSVIIEPKVREVFRFCSSYTIHLLISGMLYAWKE